MLVVIDAATDLQTTILNIVNDLNATLIVDRFTKSNQTEQALSQPELA